jgi:hypothetical protein
MSVVNLLGIPPVEVYYWAICIQKRIGYPSKGGENGSLELRINVCREFIGNPSKAGILLGYLYTKAYRVFLKGW